MTQRLGITSADSCRLPVEDLNSRPVRFCLSISLSERHVPTMTAVKLVRSSYIYFFFKTYFSYIFPGAETLSVCVTRTVSKLRRTLFIHSTLKR